MSSCLLDLQQPESSSSMKPPDGISQQGWEEQGACAGTDVQDSSEDSSPLLLDRLHSLAEAEKLFDELTQEKLQVRQAQCVGHFLTAHHVTHGIGFHVSQEISINSAQEIYLKDSALYHYTQAYTKH